MRGLSLSLSLGVSVACVVVGCGTGKNPGGGGMAREVGGGPSVATGGQGSTPIQMSLGGGPDLGVGTTPLMDAGVPDANIDAGECATLSVETHELVATVDLLVDTSGSMFQQPAPFWTPLYNALMDSTRGVVKPLEASTRFGFTSYTGVGDSV